MQKQTGKYTAKRRSSIVRGANAVVATEEPQHDLASNEDISRRAVQALMR
jgi:hypothetical protein